MARGSVTFSAHTLKMDSGVSLPLKLDLAAGNLCHCESFSAQCDSQKSTDGWILRHAHEQWWSLSVVVDHFWLMIPPPPTKKVNAWRGEPSVSSDTKLCFFIFPSETSCD